MFDRFQAVVLMLAAIISFCVTSDVPGQDRADGQNLLALPSNRTEPLSKPGQQASTSPEARPTGTAEIRRGNQPTEADATDQPQTPRQKWEARIQQQREERLREQQRLLREEANRPTAWQLQNPSGAQNRYPTERYQEGYIAPNTYYGQQFRQWSQMSLPVYETSLPPLMRSVPPLNQTNVMVAPYSYWGQANQQWNMISPGGAAPYPLGGWNMHPGW